MSLQQRGMASSFTQRLSPSGWSSVLSVPTPIQMDAQLRLVACYPRRYIPGREDKGDLGFTLEAEDIVSDVRVK